ncbi:hypothetical protein J6590_103720, partial [Homalodisca vitripennis]
MTRALREITSSYPTNYLVYTLDETIAFLHNAISVARKKEVLVRCNESRTRTLQRHHISLRLSWTLTSLRDENVH